MRESLSESSLWSAIALFFGVMSLILSFDAQDVSRVAMVVFQVSALILLWSGVHRILRVVQRNQEDEKK